MLVKKEPPKPAPRSPKPARRSPNRWRARPKEEPKPPEPEKPENRRKEERRRRNRKVARTREGPARGKKAESVGVLAFKSTFADLMEETAVAKLGAEAR
jgi:hypothetical protein